VIAAALVLLLAAAPASALETQPEYQSLTETEQEDGFEGPDRLGSEYQSDVLTFTKPDAWEYDWLANRQVLDVNVGSVSSTHFLIDNRLKVHAPLSDHLEFRFTYADERDRERDATHHMLELVVRPVRSLPAGLVFYGEPHLYKRDDDTGIALLLEPAPRHEIRLFNTFVDVARLRRNDRNDTYIEPYLPYSRGLVGRIWSGQRTTGGFGDFLEYAVRYDTKTKWLFPDEQYEYDYWKVFAYAYGSVEARPGLRLTGRFQFDRKSELRFPTSPSSSIAAEGWLTDRFFGIVRALWPGIGPRGSWDLTVGVEYAYRHWKIDADRVEYRDLLPHGILSFPAFGEGALQDRFEVGYDLTWHRVRGPRSRLLPEKDDKDGAVEQRLNLGYQFNWGEKAAIRLVATADIDEFGTARSWEGGLGQVWLTF
jgi:hypothetical protein